MRRLQVREIAFLAMMTALSMVFARLLSIQVHNVLRISLTNLPVMLTSLWFGPIAGAAVGFASDFIGANFLSPFGWNPLLAPTSIIMGVLPGLLKFLFRDKTYKGIKGSLLLIFIAMTTNALGTIAYSTFALSYMFGMTIPSVLVIRGPAYVLVAVVEGICLYYIYKSGLANTIRGKESS